MLKFPDKPFQMLRIITGLLSKECFALYWIVALS